MAVSPKMARFFRGSSEIRKMFEQGLRLKAEHGEDSVVDLSIGNPVFDPPASFTKALRSVASIAGRHAYMPNAGYPYVRERVAKWLEKKGYFSGIGGEHIVMTSGAAGALNVVLKTILSPGDEVVVIKPYFVEYAFYIDNHGGEMVLAETDELFDPDLSNLASVLSEKTRAVIINSPNNPSGRIYSRNTLVSLAQLLRAFGEKRGSPVYLISDEPYREICFSDEPFVSPASVYENSFLCYSWSKSFSIPGERIGYLAVNPAMETDDMGVLCGTLAMSNRILGFINAPAFMQHVLAESLDTEPDIRHYRKKRDKLAHALSKGGYDFLMPEGTFYLFPKTPGPEAEFMAAAIRNLMLVVPGSAFGREGYFRICFACNDDTVDRACEKLMALAPVTING